MAARNSLNSALFHFTTETPDEFMRAPTVHVGDLEAAVGRADSQGDLGYIYALSPDNVVVDETQVRDGEANVADKEFLESRGLRATPLVGSSAIRNELFRPERAEAAVKALSENRAVPYLNAVEGGTQSLVVPSPQMNTHILNGGQPLTRGQIAMTLHRRALGKVKEYVAMNEEATGTDMSSLLDLDRAPLRVQLLNNITGRRPAIARRVHEGSHLLPREGLRGVADTTDTRTEEQRQAERDLWEEHGDLVPKMYTAFRDTGMPPVSPSRRDSAVAGPQFTTPAQQPTLPLDWTKFNPSERTQRQQRERMEKRKLIEQDDRGL